MAEDIQISADTSQAVKEISRIATAMEQVAKASQGSSTVTSAMLKGIERSTASMTAQVLRGASATKQAGDAQNAWARQGTQAAQRMNAEAKAYQATLQGLMSTEERRAAAQRASQSMSVKANSAGQMIDRSTGQFVSGASTKGYEQSLANQLNLAQRLTARTDDLARARERSARQLQLETAFASKFYGVADQGAGPLKRLSNLMMQIPPATWNAKLNEYGSRIMNMSNSTRYALYDVSYSLGIAGAAMVGFGSMAITAAVSHERAFANVRRTTQTTEAGYKSLESQLEAMAASMPVTYQEITQIATAAGQLGIGASGVAQFTETVAKLSATTNLTSDAAATALARFRAFFAEVGADKGLNVTEATFGNLASSILKVGVNSIATETGIVNVATQIASMGQYSGMTANQVIGLAGALSSIGVAPELSRGTITRTFSLIGTAVSEGGEKLEKFASLSGMSAEQFKASWGTDTFASTFQAMMQGLYGVTQSGEDANLMLMDLGFNSVRDRPLLLRLAGAADEAGRAGGLLGQTMEDALDGWRDNSELAIQYGKISQTTSARIQVLGQAFERLFASTGKQSGSFLGEAAAGLTMFVNGLHDLSQTDGGQIFSTMFTWGMLLVGALALLGSGAARFMGTLQSLGTAWTAMTTAGVAGMGRLSAAFKVMQLSMGIVGIIGAIAGLVVGFGAMADAGAKAKRGVQDIGGLLSAMKADTAAGSDGLKIFATESSNSADEQARAAKQASLMGAALGTVSREAANGADGVRKYTSAVLTVGDATKSFVKSQLAASETFQGLFDMDKHWAGLFGTDFGGISLKDMGFNPADLDWNALLQESFTEGGIDRAALREKIRGLIGEDAMKEGGAALGIAVHAYADDIGDAYGKLGNEARAAQDAAAALGSTSVEALKSMTEGTDLATASMMGLDDATQKAVEAAAKGFEKFADPKQLISLTQTEVDGKNSGDPAKAAADFEKAWANAYGGTSFKLEEYLGNFRRAAGEQEGFIKNLETLSARGLSTSIIEELSAMGPEANRLVQALVTGTDAQLKEYEALWGKTGFDSMVQMAAQMRLAQDYVDQAMAAGGIDGVKRFNEAMAKGISADQALKNLQAELNGNPVHPQAKPVKLPNMTWAEKKIWEQQNQLTATARVYVTPIANGSAIEVRASGGGKKVTLTPGHAEGGWTGPGSKYTPAGTVHADEFVMTKKATNAIGVPNLYSLMAQAERGRIAPRGRGKGYAGGGHVGNGMGMGGPNIVYLSPEDRALLRSIQPIVRIGDRDIARAESAANFVSKRQGVG